MSECHPVIIVENSCYTTKGGYIVPPPHKTAVYQVELTAHTSVVNSHHPRIIEQLRQIKVTILQDNPVPVKSLRDIVDFMRKNETSFPHFRNSNTYKLFDPPVFENKRQQTDTGFDCLKHIR